jgi:hypothetical protein
MQRCGLCTNSRPRGRRSDRHPPPPQPARGLVHVTAHPRVGAGGRRRPGALAHRRLQQAVALALAPALAHRHLPQAVALALALPQAVAGLLGGQRARGCQSAGPGQALGHGGAQAEGPRQGPGMAHRRLAQPEAVELPLPWRRTVARCMRPRRTPAPRWKADAGPSTRGRRRPPEVPALRIRAPPHGLWPGGPVPGIASLDARRQGRPGPVQGCEGGLLLRCLRTSCQASGPLGLELPVQLPATCTLPGCAPRHPPAGTTRGGSQDARHQPTGTVAVVPLHNHPQVHSASHRSERLDLHRGQHLPRLGTGPSQQVEALVGRLRLPGLERRDA